MDMHVLFPYDVNLYLSLSFAGEWRSNPVAGKLSLIMSGVTVRLGQ